jgi:phosphoglycerate dehydrogenase-like enzyme
MRESAVLVDVARGALVDVTAVEPLPPCSPLWSLDGAYLSPHSSTAPEGYLDRLLELFRVNLERCVGGRPLVNGVDPSHGY